MIDLDQTDDDSANFRQVVFPEPTKALLLLQQQKQYENVNLNEIIQISPDTWDITCLISARIKETNGLALIIDYGTELIRSNRLRGIKDHKWVSPFSLPGEVDVSSDVEFSTISLAAKESGTCIA